MDYKVWKADYDRISAAVLPYVEQHDTFAFVTDECPAGLRNIYAGICQSGYANGFL